MQGSITKAGNTHARRLRIESAWHHRKSYTTSGPTMRPRWAKVEPALRAHGHAGNRRLNKRWRNFTERGKNPFVVNVAIARELPAGAGHWRQCNRQPASRFWLTQVSRRSRGE
uniref:hypothetical protein n=1 Tax=Mycolicibacterium fluoranthenivorans TaxID=258505 RepID=UPI0038B26E3C